MFASPSPSKTAPPAHKNTPAAAPLTDIVIPIIFPDYEIKVSEKVLLGGGKLPRFSVGGYKFGGQKVPQVHPKLDYHAGKLNLAPYPGAPSWASKT